MFPKIFFDQIFRRRNEIELTVDSIFLKCANDIVFTTISKCMKSQIITIEHFQPEDDYGDKQVAKQADTNSVRFYTFPPTGVEYFAE